MAIAPFSALYTFFDSSIVAVVQNGTAKMISLVSPLMAACFGIYLMLVLSSYWRGDIEEPVTDFFFRMIGWAAVIVFGLNIATYTQYVVPFVSGLGDDLAGAVGQKYNSAAALDTMANAFLDAFVKLYQDADGIKQTVFAMIAIASVTLFGGAFMVVAIVYIILAKLALGILVAVGPIFIGAALFPATREFFKNWTAQCINYAVLTMLFSFVAQVEIQMVKGLVPSDLSLSSLLMLILTCAVFVFVSMNLPGLASSLAGGIAVTVRKPRLGGGGRGGNDEPKIGGGGDAKGGEIKGTEGAEKK